MDLTSHSEVASAAGAQALATRASYLAPQGADEVVPADVPCNLIDVDFNYRRRREDPAEWNAFVEDLRVRGLAQRVVLRRLPNGRFQLVAGNRRFRGVVQAFGLEATIRADIRIMSDEAAAGMMAAENDKRKNPSAIEDAELAVRMLGYTKGDRDEAALRLGWDRRKFDRRAALMYAIDKVRDAYLDDKLDLGHVEIFASLRKEVQERVVTALMDHLEKTGQKCSVDQLKAMAEQSLLNLEAAIFDRAECGPCHHNTGNQQTLFDHSFAGTRCTNRECYTRKTDAALEARKDKLTETYQVVRIVRPGDNATVIPLRAEGKHPVGAEQALACRTCGDFGACVSGLPDSLGKTVENVCFNKPCNDAKVSTYRRQLEDADKAAQKLDGEPAAGAQAQEGDDSASNGSSEGVSGGGESKDGDLKRRAPAASASSVRNQVKEYREGIWRAVFQQAVKKLPMEKNRTLLLAIVLHRPSHLDAAGAVEAINKALGITIPSHATKTKSLMQMLLGLNREQLGVAFQHVAAHVTQSMLIDELVGFLDALGIQIEHHWRVNETFFDILTKTELDAVCTEIGLAAAAGKTYTSLRNGSKKDFVAAMLKVDGFQYLGAVPKLMRWDTRK